MLGVYYPNVAISLEANCMRRRSSHLSLSLPVRVCVHVHPEQDRGKDNISEQEQGNNMGSSSQLNAKDGADIIWKASTMSKSDLHNRHEKCVTLEQKLQCRRP